MEKELITKQAIKAVLRDFWGQYKKNPWCSTVAFTAPALGSILLFFLPPLILAKIINTFIANGTIDITSVINYIILYGVSWLVGELLWRIGEHFLIKLKAISIKSLSENALNNLIQRDYSFYADNFVGSLTKKTIAYSGNFETFTDTITFNIGTAIFPLLFALVILWNYSFWIPLFLLFGVGLGFLIIIPLIKKRAHLVILRHDSGSKSSGRLSDLITNILNVKIFAREDMEKNTYGVYVNDFADKFKKAADFNNMRLNMAITPLYVLFNLIGLIISIFFTQKLGLEIGTIIVVYAYYSQISRIFWEINFVYRRIESSINEAAEFTQFFIEPAKVLDIKNAEDLKVSNTDIVFKDVNFKYSNQGHIDSFLNNFNLNIKSNQKVGLIGPSGSGKTTITKLLLRFVDLNSGSIMVDGKDISRVTQKSLRRLISYVPQEPLLFHRSILENISYGKENATKEEIINASKIAHAHEFVEKLPNGYDTFVGERGIKLSGGQRQRIAIARALLKNSPILILDEATSSLDSESEKYIQEGLIELMKNKTTIVIAHRLSTIKHLDRILVLKDGEIIEDGNHNDLIEQKGLYTKLWEHQSGGFMED